MKPTHFRRPIALTVLLSALTLAAAGCDRRETPTTPSGTSSGTSSGSSGMSSGGSSGTGSGTSSGTMSDSPASAASR